MTSYEERQLKERVKLSFHLEVTEEGKIIYATNEENN